MKKLFAEKRRLAKIFTLLVMGLASSLGPTSSAMSGPGSDSAVADNRDMCALPPFLNVAITEKPNIMILYDNASSMSLAGYTRPYDPKTEYYGLFDNRACYKGSSSGFEKNPVFGNETVEVAGVWRVNEAWEKNAYRIANRNNEHKCDSNSPKTGDPAYFHSDYPFSGNFLNWATMRRIDLLRMAFTGGLGSNSGTQKASYLAGEGTQSAGDKFAPCFSKSYYGTGVSPYGANQVKVVDGQAVFGAQCDAADETIMARLRIPIERETATARYIFKPEDAVHTSPLSFSLAQADVGVVTPVSPAPSHQQLASYISDQPLDVPPVVEGKVIASSQNWGLRLASLFDRMSDVGLGLIGATELSVNIDSVTPTSAQPGASVLVNVTVTNHTNTNANGIQVGFDFNGTNAGSCVVSGNVKNGSKTVSCSFSVPASLSDGPYTLRATASYPGLAPGSDTTSFTVLPAPKSDFSVAIGGVSVNTGQPGDSVTFKLEVKNTGTLVSPASDVGLYWSGNMAGSCPVPSGIPIGGVTTVFCTVQVPSVPGGTYNLIARVDPFNSVSETDESNNTDVLLNAFEVIALAMPDLTISVDAVDLRAGLSGMPIQAILTVRNIGGKDAPSTTISAAFGGTSSGSTCSVPALAMGSVTKVKCTFTVPALSHDTDYALAFTVDPGNGVTESDETNNTASGPNFYVHRNHKNNVDLQAVSITVVDASTTGVPGGSEVVKVEVANVGGDDVPALTGGLLIVLSKDGIFTPGDQNVAVCNVPAMPKYPTSGWRQTITCTANFQATLDPADYQVPGSHLAALLDPNHTVGEIPDIAPNHVGTPYALQFSKPDLSISTLFATPNVGLTAGGTVDITMTIQNAGEEVKFQGIDLFGSPDATLDGSDVELTLTDYDCGDTYVIAAGDSLTITCTAEIPAGTPDGSYYVFATVDPDSTATPAEDNRANNSRSTSVIIGTGGGAVDLALSNINVPTSIPPGANLTVSFQVDNLGYASTTTWPVVQMVFDADGGNIVAYCYVKSLIPGGGSVATSCSLTVPEELGTPSVTDGNSYTLALVVDPTNAEAEANETNNLYKFSVLTEKLESCTGTAKSCSYTIKVDWGGRGRTGILWSFRSKALGTLAPANLGITTIDDWVEDGSLAGTDKWKMAFPNKFAGVDENQQPANNLIPRLESAGPVYGGKLARILLNTIKYYAFEPNFRPSSGIDPMKYDPVVDANTAEPHNCRNNYVLMISDGYSYDDWDALPSHVPTVTGDIKDYEPNGYDLTSNNPIVMSDAASYNMTVPDPDVAGLVSVGGGSYHVDNVARFARDNNIRNDGTSGSVNTVVVQAFAGGDPSFLQSRRATELMRSTAIQGNYVEIDGTPGPTSKSEFMESDGQSIRGYFSAEEGDNIADVIMAAINSVLLKTASGTSVSVIAATARGEGAIYQSYFRPTTAVGGQEISWLGYLQSIWVDRYNNLREDSDKDGRLNLKKDRIIDYQFDSASLETMARLYVDADGDGEPDTGQNPSPVPLTRLNPVFEAGKQLFLTDPDKRNIITWPHPSNTAAPTGGNPTIAFKASQADLLKSYMWPSDNVYHDDTTMTAELIDWIRGRDSLMDTFRSRTIELDGVKSTWKLGDIVYSTPTIVGAPEERYDLLYGETTYAEYFIEHRNRRRLVLVGSNDGMLHAFNGGVFREGDDPSTPDKEEAWFDKQGKELGEEVWAYVPGSLLQNLRILADAGYDTTCHLYTVDLKPKVTDVQIFFDSSGNPLSGPYKNGWGTIVIGGMRLGCGKTEFSSYFILDITDPDKPNVLAEFGPNTVAGSALDKAGHATSLEGLNFSYFYPIVMRVESDTGDKDRWYLVTGSGPDKLYFNNEKTTPGITGVYVFDLNRLGQGVGSMPGGEYPDLEKFAFLLNRFEHNSTNLVRNASYPGGLVVSGGVSADLDGDFSVDALYFTTQYDDRVDTDPATPARWGSELWRITPHDSSGDVALEDPANWAMTKVFTTRGSGVHQPIVAQPSISRDIYGSIWVYFGTGRFMNRDSINSAFDDLSYGVNPGVTAYQQSLYGIIDPCWSPSVATDFGGTCPTTAAPYTRSDVFDTSSLDTYASALAAEVRGTGTAAICGAAACSFPDLYQKVREGINGTGNYVGWRRSLPHNNAEFAAWEMSYNKPAVAGGLVLFTTYLPGYDSSAEQCALSGQSWLYALDYMAGVASPSDVLNPYSNASSSTTLQPVQASVMTDPAPPSPPAIFNKTVFVQSATARPVAVETDAQFHVKPGIRDWEEQ